MKKAAEHKKTILTWVVIMALNLFPALALANQGFDTMGGDLPFSVGGHPVGDWSASKLSITGGLSTTTTATVPSLTISGVAQPLDVNRMGAVNNLYGTVCGPDQALTATGNGVFACVGISDLFASNGGQIGTATMPACSGGEVLTSNGSNFSCVMAGSNPPGVAGCTSGQIAVSNGNNGLTCVNGTAVYSCPQTGCSGSCVGGLSTSATCSYFLTPPANRGNPSPTCSSGPTVVHCSLAGYLVPQ